VVLGNAEAIVAPVCIVFSPARWSRFEFGKPQFPLTARRNDWQKAAHAHGIGAHQQRQDVNFCIRRDVKPDPLSMHKQAMVQGMANQRATASLAFCR
jgi:hypothetical protein